MLKYRQIGIVIGKTGSGKSFLVKRLVESLDRVVVLDILAEYDKENDFTAKDFILFTEFESFKSFIKDKKETDSIRVILRFSELPYYEAAIQVCYLVGNLTLVIEEINNFCSSYYINPTLESIIRFGRHRAITVVGVTQRYHDIHNLYRANLDFVVAFNITAPTDLKYLEEVPYIGENAVLIGGLKPQEHILFSNK